MGDLLARRRELVSARAELLDRPDVALPGVPGHVVASWRRSIAGGVDPAMIVNRFHPDLDTGSRLVRCARPVMEQLVEQVAGIGVCVALTDHRARLLVRLDTDAVIARSADVNAFAAGFGYAEGAVGTNGVGTVLGVRPAGAHRRRRALRRAAPRLRLRRRPGARPGDRADRGGTRPVLPRRALLAAAAVAGALRGRAHLRRPAPRPRPRPAGPVRRLRPHRVPHPAGGARRRAPHGAGEHRDADPARRGRPRRAHRPRPVPAAPRPRRRRPGGPAVGDTGAAARARSSRSAGRSPAWWRW
jgi:hypothetical protein